MAIKNPNLNYVSPKNLNTMLLQVDLSKFSIGIIMNLYTCSKAVIRFSTETSPNSLFPVLAPCLK